MKNSTLFILRSVISHLVLSYFVASSPDVFSRVSCYVSLGSGRTASSVASSFYLSEACSQLSVLSLISALSIYLILLWKSFPSPFVSSISKQTFVSGLVF